VIKIKRFSELNDKDEVHEDKLKLLVSLFPVAATLKIDDQFMSLGKVNINQINNSSLFRIKLIEYLCMRANIFYFTGDIHGKEVTSSLC